MAQSDIKEGLAYWEDRWAQGLIAFHLPKAHFFLTDYFHRIADSSKNNSNVLVPFCGKTCDLLFLYEKGLTVVGVEISAIAVKAFFEENNLSFTVTEKENFTVYIHDERLCIFQGDFSKLTPDIVGGTFDLHWDRCALVALEPCSQQQYVNQLKILLSCRSRSLFESIEYTKEYAGHPRSIFLDRLQSLFGTSFKFNEIVRMANNDMPEYIDRLPDFIHVLYYIEREQ